MYVASGLGITAGAHRLWAHKSYKAKWPLRLILIIFNTLAFQVNICVGLLNMHVWFSKVGFSIVRKKIFKYFFLLGNVNCLW